MTFKPLIKDVGQTRQLRSGDTLQLPAGVAEGAPLNMPQGVAPTSPANGDFWVTSAGVYVRVGGAIVGPFIATRCVQFAVSDPNGAAITVGDGKFFYRIGSKLNGMNLIGAAAALSNASSSGIPTIQLARIRAASPADMLSTKITIDATEVDSSSAVAPAVIDAANDDVLTADQIRVDVDVAGTNAKGLMIDLMFALP